MTFRKGKSGNPGGRAKVALEFRLTCRVLTDELVIKRWEAEVRKKGPDWVACSKLLAQYGYGKPATEVRVTALGTHAPPSLPAPVEGSVVPGKLLQTSPTEKLEQLLASLDEPSTPNTEH